VSSSECLCPCISQLFFFSFFCAVRSISKK
jgi:hypothetical protein